MSLFRNNLTATMWLQNLMPKILKQQVSKNHLVHNKQKIFLYQSIILMGFFFEQLATNTRQKKKKAEQSSWNSTNTRTNEKNQTTKPRKIKKAKQK